MKWRPIYKESRFPKKRKLCYWEAVDERREFRFRVMPMGGFITNRRWIMTVEYIGTPGDVQGHIFGMRFWSFREAKQWAEEFCSSEGARVSAAMLSPSYI